MDENCEVEVQQLHRFFEEWFRGELPPTGEAFLRISDVLAEDFEIISPGGEHRSRTAVVDGLREAHGSQRDEPFRIWIEKARGRRVAEGLHVVTYEEWQETAGEQRGRLSTAVFRRRPGTPNGVEWVHVHEVWLPEAGGD